MTVPVFRSVLVVVVEPSGFFWVLVDTFPEELPPLEEPPEELPPEEEPPVASVIMNKKQVRFDGHIVKMGGVGGVATLPQYRRRGGIRDRRRLRNIWVFPTYSTGRDGCGSRKERQTY